MKIINNKHVINGILLINIALIVVLILTLSDGYFVRQELNNITTKCYESDGTVKMDIQDLSKGKYSFECVKD